MHRFLFLLIFFFLLITDYKVPLQREREIRLFDKEHKEAHGEEGEGHKPLKYPVEVGVEAHGERVSELLHDLVCDLDHNDPGDALVWAGDGDRVEAWIAEDLLVKDVGPTQQESDRVAWAEGGLRPDSTPVNNLKLDIKAKEQDTNKSSVVRGGKRVKISPLAGHVGH